MTVYLDLLFSLVGLGFHIYGVYLWAWRNETLEAIMLVILGMGMMQ